MFAVKNGAGLPWTASSGVISAVRSADEVPGAGSGYRLLQFTAPLSPGSSGGVLVDGQARALAIVVGFLSAGQNVNFAIPLDSIVGNNNNLVTNFSEDQAPSRVRTRMWSGVAQAAL